MSDVSNVASDAPDQLLRMLLQVFATNERGIEMTLMADGVLVSGFAISPNSYANLFAHRLGQGVLRLNEEDKEDLRLEAVLLQMTESVSKAGASSFLHLRDATIRTARGDILSDLWKIRLSTVSAWNLGRLGPERAASGMARKPS